MIRSTVLALSVLAVTGCAAHSRSLAPALEPLRFEATAEQQALTENHFTRDRATAVSEADLKEILSAPVFLEENARIGVVPVAARYELEGDVPLSAVPAALTDALEGSGMFELASEVSTDWPIDRGVPGLRELAARYRTEYLLFYRHRFADQSYLNAWAWAYPSIVGAFVVPAHTLEAAGVLEATLFDVKTGTILFTVFERVHGQREENIWNHERKLTELKRKLLEEASRKLADQVLGKSRRLVAARPGAPAGQEVTRLEGPPAS